MGDRLERNIEELVEDVVMESDLYKKLKNSTNICSVIGYLALPECATNEGLNMFDKLDDKCAENKTNSIKNSLLKLLQLEIEVSGQAIFRSCKDIVVKQLKGQFEKMLELISGLCDQSLSTSTRRKRSYGGGYGGGYHGGYDPATIWFQYLLCHEQKITCYFFTDGWNDKQYGQYYLYQNVLDTGFDSLGDDDDLLALLLLSGGGGLQQHPYQAYPAYPSYRKRRDVDEVKDAEDDGRRRRNAPTTTEDDENKAVISGGSRRRRTVPEAPVKSTAASTNGGGRKRREGGVGFVSETDETKTSGDRRRRRTVTEAPVKSTTTAASTNGGGRKRRSSGKKNKGEETTGGGRKRRSEDEEVECMGVC